MRLYNSLTDLPQNTEFITYDATLKQWTPGTIFDLGTIPAIDAANDFVMIYDATDSLNKKISITDLLASVSGSITVAGTSGPSQTIALGDTLTFAAEANSNLEVVMSATDTATVGLAVSPTTGGTVQQVLIFDDNTDSYSWGAPISIAAGSTGSLAYDTATRELSVTPLLITDTTVDTVQTSLAAYVATTPTHEHGDIIILQNATGGQESYIISGANGSVVGNYTQLNTGGAITALSLAGDSGAAQAITEGNTISILGGDLLASVASATDTITVGWDAAALAAGDIIQSNGTTMQVLNIGTAGQVLQVNGGATALEYVTLPGSTFTAAADSGVNNVITVGTDTFSILGGVGINTVSSATDTITISAAPAATGAVPVAADVINFFDSSDTGNLKETPLNQLSWTIAANGAGSVSQTISLFDILTVTGEQGIEAVATATDGLRLRQTVPATAIVEADYVYAADTINVYDASATEMKSSTLEEVLLTNQYRAVTTSTTATAEDEIIEVISSAAATTITLPAATAVSVGRRYTIVMPIDAAAMVNDVVINGGGTNINTEASFTINTVGTSVTLVSNGTIWRIV